MLLKYVIKLLEVNWFIFNLINFRQEYSVNFGVIATVYLRKRCEHFYKCLRIFQKNVTFNKLITLIISKLINVNIILYLYQYHINVE